MGLSFTNYFFHAAYHFSGDSGDLAVSPPPIFGMPLPLGSGPSNRWDIPTILIIY